MSVYLFGAAREEQATSTDFSESSYTRAGIATILGCLILLTACGSSPVPATNNALPAAHSVAMSISATLPAATVGASYAGSLTVVGGVAPYTFSVASGALPSGVSLNDSTGNVSGTPSASGSFNFAVAVSDAQGVSKQQDLAIAVASAPTSSPPAPTPTPTPSPTAPASGQSSGKSFSSLQHAAGWGQFGQGPPKFVDCSPSPCDGISFWMNQGVKSPSMSGQATEFNVGGGTPYSDALWNNHLIGPLSSQGLFDKNQTEVPALHDFTYDVYFFGDNLGLAQALEFDINQFFGNMGFIFGHECRIASGNEWDVWDNEKGHWTPTGIPCYPNSNSWNHLTIKVRRTSDNHLVYQSITLNGMTKTLNWTFGHGSANGWYGLTINYQMDGNQHQDSYNMYLDNLTFSYQ